MKLVLLILAIIISASAFTKNIYYEAAVQNDNFEKEQTYRTSVGIEFFQKFSNGYGDFLTTDLQLRIPYQLKEEIPGSLTMEVHNAWFEYKAGLGKFIRFGHFSPAFGLEYVTDTHGSLAQTMAMQNIGFKQDWGVGYRSFIGSCDYNLAIQMGSGMAIRDGGYLITGRIASPDSKDLQYAFSALYGDVHDVMSMATYPAKESMGIINKQRVAAEIFYNFGAYYLSNELSLGYNDYTQIISNFAELEFKSFMLPNFNFIVQNKFFQMEENNTISWLSGTSYKIIDALTLSILYSVSDEILQFRIYYFG